MVFCFFHVHKEGCDFWLDRDDLCYFSESTKAILRKFCKCAKCGNNIKKDFSPCSCLTKRKKNPRRGLYRITEEQLELIWPHLKRDERRVYSKISGAIRKERLSKAGGYHTNEDIYRIWKLQDGKCYFCWKLLGVSFPELDETPTLPLRELYEIEHLTPISKDGTKWPYNIALTCKECNQQKGARTEASFWNLLRKQHGVSWVAKRKALATKNRGAKRKLTNIRKKELEIKRQKSCNRGEIGNGIGKRKS